MAYEEPFTQWSEDRPLAVEDMNRIEGNIKALKEEDLTINGNKTFTGNVTFTNISGSTITTPTLSPGQIVDISGSGVTIEGVRLNNGILYGGVWAT